MKTIIAALIVGAALLPAVAGAQAPPTTAECLACHDQIDGTKFAASVHGSLFQCADCHTDVRSAPHETRPQRPQCESCHAEEVSAWKHSEHARWLYQGVGGAQCIN